MLVSMYVFMLKKLVRLGCISEGSSELPKCLVKSKPLVGDFCKKTLTMYVFLYTVQVAIYHGNVYSASCNLPWCAQTNRHTLQLALCGGGCGGKVNK